MNVVGTVILAVAATLAAFGCSGRASSGCPACDAPDAQVPGADAAVAPTDGGGADGGGGDGGSAHGGDGGLPAGIGWHALANTQLAPLCPAYADIHATEGCPAVMADWSGGLFDAQRNRLVVWGGGHSGYFGNEIYAIDLNATPVQALLVHDASHGSAISNVTSCPEAYLDGTPVSRHTYSGFVYLAKHDLYFAHSGSRANCGYFSSGSWTYDPAANAWTKLTIAGPAPNPAGDGSAPALAYDSATDSVYKYEINTGAFWQYSVSTNAWTDLHDFGSPLPCNTLDLSVDTDPVRHAYVCIGHGQFSKIDLNAPHLATNLAGTGCSALVGTAAPGWAYDSKKDLFVGWAGGDTVYLYDPVTDACTPQTFPGGPTSIQSNGTYGRFRYSPGSDVFVVANDVAQEAYSLRLP